MFEINKKDCINFEDCKKYLKEEDLCCEYCDHYIPDSCFEDYEGRKPFWILSKGDKICLKKK